jgi:hypothetical protein
MRSERLFGSATTAALHGLCLAFLDRIFRLSGPSILRGKGWQRSLVPVSASRRGRIEQASQPPHRTGNHKGPAMP